MGNFSSKIFSRHNSDEDKSDIQVPVTMGNLEKLEKSQMCTPLGSRKPLLDDPRSASSGIARTPIEVPRYIASALPKHLRIKKYLETDLDNVIMSSPPEERSIPDPRSPNIDHQRTPILMKSVPNYLSPVVVVKEGPDSLTPEGVGIDPRSPAINFDRTPILKPKSSEHTQVPQEINKLEKNSSNTRISYCETKSGFPSVVEVQALPEEMFKPSCMNFKQRLLAYRDHDSSGQNSDEESSSDESVSEEQITVIPNLKAQKIDGNLQMNDTIDEELLGKELESDSNVEGLKEAEETRGKIRVWRDSISPQPTENINIDEVKKNSEEIIIEFDDESVLTSTKSEPQKLTVKVDEKIKSKIPVRSMVVQSVAKDFKNYFAEVAKMDEAPKNRTPLGNRSNNSKPGLHNQSPQQLFRNKGLSNNQQENTPPNMKRFRTRNNKTNGTTWDPDTTVII